MWGLLWAFFTGYARGWLGDIYRGVGGSLFAGDSRVLRASVCLAMGSFGPVWATVGSSKTIFKKN